MTGIDGEGGRRRSENRSRNKFQLGTADFCPKPCKSDVRGGSGGGARRGAGAPGACRPSRRARRYGLSRGKRRWGQALGLEERRADSRAREERSERVGRDAPRGPRVTPTASATMSMPSWILIRDFMSKVSSLASARTLRVAPRTRTAREERAVVALPARAWRIGWGGMGLEGLAAAPWKL